MRRSGSWGTHAFAGWPRPAFRIAPRLRPVRAMRIDDRRTSWPRLRATHLQQVLPGGPWLLLRALVAPELAGRKLPDQSDTFEQNAL